MSLTISIKNPCSENWNSFERRGDSGFCLSCQKNVVDFTKYSDEEVIEYFRKHRSEKTCGRLNDTQLKTYSLPKKKSDLNGIAAALAAGLLAIANPAESQVTTSTYEATMLDDNGVTRTPGTSNKEGWYRINGQVFHPYDDSKMPGVAVVIKGIDKGTYTDANGKFSLDYYGEESERIMLELSFAGYGPMEREIYLWRKITDLSPITFRIEIPTTILMGEVVYSDPWYRPRRWWMGITSIFTK